MILALKKSDELIEEAEEYEDDYLLNYFCGMSPKE